MLQKLKDKYNRYEQSLSQSDVLFHVLTVVLIATCLFLIAWSFTGALLVKLFSLSLDNAYPLSFFIALFTWPVAQTIYKFWKA